MSKPLILHFDKAGLQTLVQDSGRPGHQAFGVPLGGAVDQAAARIANGLVGNALDAPVLEITLMGPKIRISDDGQIALTGADLSPKLNELEMPMYETVNMKNGDLLSFGPAKFGCRAYLAIGGNWKVKQWLGSSSAAVHGGAVLTPDSIIQKNDQLIIQTKKAISPKIYPKHLRPVLSPSVKVRVLPGPDLNAFSAYAVAQFFNYFHRLAADSNRMGCRLETRLQFKKPPQELISSGIVPGTIQVTNSGQPIVLLADAQTTGGYYRIANVITADMDLMGQLKAGDRVWFSLVSLSEAYAALEASYQRIDFINEKK